MFICIVCIDNLTAIMLSAEDDCDVLTPAEDWQIFLAQNCPREYLNYSHMLLRAEKTDHSLKFLLGADTDRMYFL